MTYQAREETQLSALADVWWGLGGLRVRKYSTVTVASCKARPSRIKQRDSVRREDTGVNYKEGNSVEGSYESTPLDE